MGISVTKNKWDGDAFRWLFEVIVGPATGAVAERTTGCDPKLGTALAAAIEESLGRKVGPNEDHDLEAFIGREFWVVVAPMADGGVRVAKVSPLSKEAE